MCSTLTNTHSEDMVVTADPDQQLTAVTADNSPAAAEQPQEAESPAASVQQQQPQSSNEHNNDATFTDLNDFNSLEDDEGYQCENCSSKFMSETSMRIHVVQCNKSRARAEQELMSQNTIKR